MIPLTPARRVRYNREGFTVDHYGVNHRESRFTVRDHGIPFCHIRTGLIGEHNASNILACAAAAREIGIPAEAVEKALADFSGIRRRQEIRGIKNGITVMDDFAHHPSAVRETIAAVKPFYPKGRVIAVFEPRTNTSMRQIFQDVYPESFTQADMVIIARPGKIEKIPLPERVNPEKLTADICSLGVDARFFNDTDAIVEFPGD